MKSTDDLVRGWVRKAESDLTNARLCLAAAQALDTACFHAQQAAERYLKAYLAAHHVDFPYIHNIEKLLNLCTKLDPAFASVKELGQSLTPYAVELRYDDDFWPSAQNAREALATAETIIAFVRERLPVRPDQADSPAGDFGTS
jgi:HEPN domain-containing protein